MGRHLASIASLIGVLALGCDAPSPRSAGVDDASPLAIDASHARVRVEVAARADGIHRLTDLTTGTAVGFRLRGARPVLGARTNEAAVTFEGALDGAVVDTWTSARGIEDFYRFAERPREERLTYDLDVSRVDALRAPPNMLEFLDADGVPRLRVSPPYFVDARGRARPIHLELVGCDADRDPRSSIGRAIPPVGATSCEMVLDWSDANAEYPIVVDPDWSTTGEMTMGRTKHTLTVVPGGAIAIGGAAIPSPADVFVWSGTPTDSVWSATMALPGEERDDAFAASLPDGSVLIASGTNWDTGDTSRTVERFDPLTQTFTTLPTVLSAGHLFGASATGAGGRVAIVGGIDWNVYAPRDTAIFTDVAEVFDPATMTFTPTAVEQPRAAPSAAALPDGRILVTGGQNVFTDVAVPEAMIGATAILDPVTGAWSTAPDIPTRRSDADAVSLFDGRVVLVGGFQDGYGAVHETDIFDPASATWSTGPTLQRDRLAAVTLRMPSGAIMTTGGCCTLRATEMLLVGSNAWSQVEALEAPRSAARGVLLENGHVLVAGGNTPDFVPQATAEIFDRAALGQACSQAVDCGSGVCSDGVCCDAACADPCFSCHNDLTGDAEGACKPVKAGGPDPTFTCVDTLANSCGTTGRCDGKGGCATYEAGTTCAATACGDSAGQCDGSGNCSCPSPTCSADGRFYGATDCAPYLCTGSGCGSTCSTSASCAKGYVCDRTSHCVVDVPQPAAPDGCALSSGAGAPFAPGVIALATAASILSVRRRRASKGAPR